MAADFTTELASRSGDALVNAVSALKLEQGPTGNSRDSNIAFHFKLPEDGLALRSVTINADGEPELRFDASPKVPTILEEDVATVFRLVSEDKRPGFFYTGFDPSHPLHHSRLFMQYSPAWLRWTPIGDLLADADWSMKCLNVGTRTDKEKSVFKSWSEGSQLEGLASHLDFPKDDLGPTMMSCEYAKVQKGDNEIVFPEEPKMKIKDGCSSLYSKYITQNYQSVAYYDEPKFLKMQELIKLILGVEWLYKEKGVRVNREWMMKHTSKRKAAAQLDLSSTKKPPYEMIPQPTEFERPCSDVTVKTWEAEMYKTLKTEYNVERRYGYYDFGGAEVIMFKEDGTPCPPQKCLKFGIEHRSIIDGMPADMMKVSAWFYLPFPQNKMFEPTELRDELLKHLPKNSCKMITFPVPASVDTKVDDSTDESGVEVKVTNAFQPCAPLALPPLKEITVMTATMDNYDKLFANMDPNEPLQPEIPGVCEEISPGVESWDELINEMTVPVPRAWQAPFIGVGEPTARGGVTTHDFQVKKEPLRRKVVPEETQWKDNYKRSGRLLVVRAAHVTAQGTIRLVDRRTAEFAEVSRKFSGKWIKGSCPPVSYVFTITNSTLERQWTAYGQTLQHHVRTITEEHFHGTTLACNITVSQALCSDGNCGICGISCAGLDPQYIRMNIDFQRYGHGYYLAPNSSKCHDYTQGAHGYRAMLLCEVRPGNKYQLKINNQKLTGPPQGYDSVYGQVGSKLNYPEIVLYNPHAVMPRYIIVYKKDGVEHPLAS